MKFLCLFLFSLAILNVFCANNDADAKVNTKRKDDNGALSTVAGTLRKAACLVLGLQASFFCLANGSSLPSPMANDTNHPNGTLANNQQIPSQYKIGNGDTFVQENNQLRERPMGNNGTTTQSFSNSTSRKHPRGGASRFGKADGNSKLADFSHPRKLSSRKKHSSAKEVTLMEDYPHHAHRNRHYHNDIND